MKMDVVKLKGGKQSSLLTDTFVFPDHMVSVHIIPHITSNMRYIWVWAWRTRDLEHGRLGETIFKLRLLNKPWKGETFNLSDYFANPYFDTYVDWCTINECSVVKLASEHDDSPYARIVAWAKGNRAGIIVDNDGAIRGEEPQVGKVELRIDWEDGYDA